MQSSRTDFSLVALANGLVSLKTFSGSLFLEASMTTALSSVVISSSVWMSLPPKMAVMFAFNEPLPAVCTSGRCFLDSERVRSLCATDRGAHSKIAHTLACQYWRLRSGHQGESAHTPAIHLATVRTPS